MWPASNGERRASTLPRARARDDGSDGDDAKIGVGDKVRAKYKGRAKEYDGVIKDGEKRGAFRRDLHDQVWCWCCVEINHRRDATPWSLKFRFARYDDGEIETYVNKKFITVTRAKSRSRSRSKSDDSRSKKKRRDRSRSSSSSRSRSPKRGRQAPRGRQMHGSLPRRWRRAGKVLSRQGRSYSSDGL